MTDSIADTSIEEEIAQANPENTDVIQGEAPEGGSSSTSWRDILLADAPQDDGTYQSHALNWDNEESTGKIIRGFEGITGNLNKALILIGMGVIQKVTEYQGGDDSKESGDSFNQNSKDQRSLKEEDLGAELEGEEI
ncbi:MAG: hypothetical protein ACI8Z7_000185 [Candidatus Nanohaloarchaea archaeon]|jgi:hypothetical protein